MREKGRPCSKMSMPLRQPLAKAIEMIQVFVQVLARILQKNTVLAADGQWPLEQNRLNMTRI